MSSKARWMIVLGDHGWIVVRAAGDAKQKSPAAPYDCAAPGDVAESVRRVLDEWNYQGESVLLALGSSWCVSATLAVDTARKARTRTAMSYLMEAHLPWSAEEAVVDYELDGSEAFVVAAATEPLAGLLKAFQARTVAIASIAPLARLALDHHLRTAPAIEGRQILVWRSETSVDLWLIDGNRPVSWNWAAAEADSIAQAVRQTELSAVNPIAIVSRNLSLELVRVLEACTHPEWKPAEPVEGDDPLDAGIEAALSILDGRTQAPIELYREPLPIDDPNRSIRPHLRMLNGSLYALLASIGVALFIQSRELDARSHEVENHQAAVFQTVFPGQRIPVAIHSRLEGELARLNGMRGQRTDVPEMVTSLAGLERLLKALPNDLRLRILEVRIDNGQIYVVGQVRAHGDADRIADALRIVHLEVASPSTHRLEKEGVEFRITAKLPQPQNAKRKKAT